MDGSETDCLVPNKAMYVAENLGNQALMEMPKQLRNFWNCLRNLENLNNSIQILRNTTTSRKDNFETKLI